MHFVIKSRTTAADSDQQKEDFQNWGFGEVISLKRREVKSQNFDREGMGESGKEAVEMKGWWVLKGKILKKFQLSLVGLLVNDAMIPQRRSIVYATFRHGFCCG